MTDIRERRRREAQAELQEGLDETSERLRGADDGRVQREIEDLLASPASESRKARGEGLHEGDRLQKERDALESQLDRAADSRRVQHEIDRLLDAPDRTPAGLEGAAERIQRAERISERDPMRDLPGFDPERERRLENVEIRTNPEAFIRRHEGGLDPETERELRRSLRDRRG